MQLENSKRDFLADGTEDTVRMTISKDVESHIIRVLTEDSYDDPLGSSIREAISNAVDSVKEAGTGEPVIVSIKHNVQRQLELTIEDKGLGLDDVSFNKYIMGIGESSKRDNADLLGGYGVGSKSWLSYTDNFSYVCRKDGVERKYLIFKGEEFPESTLIYEQPTEEVNGVKITVILKNSYYEESNCKTKIKEQLSYLDGVYYDINGFDNKYTVYRSDDFQFSSLGTFKEMHISLKDIYYPIDWTKIDMSRIEVPVALRFTDYNDLKPIFNRESIQYTAATIKAIKEKIIKVADWFTAKRNEEIQEFDNLRDARLTVISSHKRLTLFDKEFTITGLCNVSTIPSVEPKVKDIEFRKPSFYLDRIHYIEKEWECNALDDRGTWKKKHVKYDFHYDLERDSSLSRIVLVDYEVSGNIKEYLRQKYKTTYTKTYYVFKTPVKRALEYKVDDKTVDYESYENVLQLTDIPKEDWDFYIEEYKNVIKQYEGTFIDERGLPVKEEYTKWLEQRKEDRKAGRIPSFSNYIALNKEEGDITLYKGRYASRGKGIVYEKDKMPIEDLGQIKHLVIYCPVKEEINEDWAWRVLKHYKIWKLNPSEIKHVKDIKQFLTIKQFMASKAFARMATAIFIKDLIDNEPKSRDIIKEAFNEIKLLREELDKYVYREDVRNFSTSKEARTAILEQAKESGNWDMEIYPTAKKYEHLIKQFGFTNALKDSYYLSETEKAIIKNVMYVMMKHQKITNSLVEDYELVPKPQPLPEETDIEEATVAMLSEEEYETFAEVINED
jgi:anti-sigma regulatory factor (Ser/Thr protein kinase)